ncbi:MAG TPA: ABC transporter ATP-binding protein, partial [Solirubrobacteraceae bacterium]|nr:ABC transporter ATP-binding protein [Solirubrobacteraceae bacterium]
ASIEFEHVTKRYKDGFEAVRDMSLEVRDGEFMILVGPSGSGKSTALRMVAGLEDITDGELRIGGELVNDLAPKDRGVAMVFQSYALYPHLTVRENMGFALKLAKVPRRVIDRKVIEAARILDLEPHLDRKPANLSGGQRQRVAMGRAIVRSPNAFLMDEPLSNLDAQLRVQTRAVIARLQQQLGITTLYVTHDQIEALTLGDRIAVMRAGVLEQVGPPGEIYGRPDNLFVAGFIGSPAMNFLPGRVEGERLRTPIGEIDVADRLRPGLASARGAARASVIVGIRPEHFEDAMLVGDRPDGHTLKATVDVLESVGSEYYAHFTVPSEPLPAIALGAVIEDHGSADARRLRDGVAMVARLGRASRVRQGQQAELWVDTSQVHLFDDQTGRNLLTKDGEAASLAPVAPRRGPTTRPRGACGASLPQVGEKGTGGR